MDTSTIVDEIAVDKTTDIPVQTKHERKRLKKRAGTISRSDRAILPRPSQRYVKSWNKKGKKPAYAVEGKNPATDRPVNKKPGEESEY